MKSGLIDKGKKSSDSSVGSSVGSSTASNCDDLPLALKAPVRRRKKLPHEQAHSPAITFLSILATRNIPMHCFEPTGDIQVCAEGSRYAKQFLNKMLTVSDPMERMVLLCGFVVSGYSGMAKRRRKPFNPLLGETYDYISEDGWRYHGEKVSHHPSITACHVEGSGWELFEVFHGKISFGLNSVSIASLLPERLKLANGDEYSWFRPTVSIQNVRAQAKDRRVLNEGKVIVKSNTGIEAKLTFYAEDDKFVAGEIVQVEDGALLCRLIGNWHRGVLPNNERSSIFEAIPPSKHAANYYGFSDFAMALNEIHDYEHPYLPFTDSRYRPDQKHLENGDLKLAEQTKKKLEQAQRKRAHIAHTPMWFHKAFDEFTGSSLWQSNKKYWTSKEAKFQDEHSRHMLQLFEKKS